MADKTELVALRHQNLKVTPTKIDAETTGGRHKKQATAEQEPVHAQQYIQKINAQARLIEEYEARFKAMEMDRETTPKPEADKTVARVEALELANKELKEQNEQLGGELRELLELLKAPGVDGQTAGAISDKQLIGRNKKELIEYFVAERLKEQASGFKQEIENLEAQLRVASLKGSTAELKLIEQESGAEYKEAKLRIAETRLKNLEASESTLIEFLTDLTSCFDNLHFSYYRRLSDTSSPAYEPYPSETTADKDRHGDPWAIKAKCDSFLIHLSNRDYTECASIMKDLTNLSKLMC